MELKELGTKGMLGGALSSLSLSGIIIVAMLGLLLLFPTVVAADSIEVKNGAAVTLQSDTVHVVWSMHIEYDDSNMADEMDDMWVTYQVNEKMDGELERQLGELIQAAVREKVGDDYDVVCKNLDLDVDAKGGRWTDVKLEFDLEGLVRISKTEREFNMSWKSMKVEGDIRLEERSSGSIIETYKFTPMQAFALDWKPFSSELDEWEITQKEDYTECYYRHKRRFPIAFETDAYDVEMLIRLPGEPVIRDNLVVYDRNYVPPTPSPVSQMLPVAVVAGAVITGIGGSVYLYKRRRTEQIEKKLFKRALARKEFQDFEEALELWGTQSEYPRLERKFGWRGGSPVLNLPKMKFNENTKNHYLDEYLLEE